MIHQYKTNICSRPVPAVEFDNFLKARYEKQTIIQSQSQPIHSKVQSFYQLLKLTKCGSNFTKQPVRKPQQTTQVKIKTQSSKTINILSQNNINEYEFNNRFEDIQSDEAQMKKLNRMVYGLSQWEQDKARVSMYIQRSEKQEGKGEKEMIATKNIGKKQSQPVERIKQRKQLAYSSCDGKRFRGFYAPLRKHQAGPQLNKITSQFTKTSSKINYPKSLLNCDFLTKKPNHFKQLKRKIKVLQDKAKNQYGLDFGRKGSYKNFKQSKVAKGSFYFGDSSQQRQSGQLGFSDLQLGPMLAKEPGQRCMFKTVKYGHKQNDLVDDSIPKGLIEGVIRNRTDSLHRIMMGNSQRIFKTAVGNSRDKLKKGYLSRPKTFKPSYMYVQI